MVRAVLALAAGVTSALVVVAGPSIHAGATVILPPDNPTASVPPQVMPACTTVDDNSAGCIDSVLHNINDARSLEGLGPMVLPPDYATGLLPEQQQLVLTDEERGDRGLAEYSGLDGTLNVAALTGARGNTDPGLPPGFEGPGGSIFAQDETPLGADFAWMYDDGYGGTNLDCASPADGGCWGHRDNILGNWTSISGETAHVGGREHGERAVRRDLRLPVQPGRLARRHDHAELAAHAGRGRGHGPRRRAGAALLVPDHGCRHPGDH